MHIIFQSMFEAKALEGVESCDCAYNNGFYNFDQNTLKLAVKNLRLSAFPAIVDKWKDVAEVSIGSFTQGLVDEATRINGESRIDLSVSANREKAIASLKKAGILAA